MKKLRLETSRPIVILVLLLLLIAFGTLANSSRVFKSFISSDRSSNSAVNLVEQDAFDPEVLEEKLNKPIDNQIIIRFDLDITQLERDEYVSSLGGEIIGSISGLDSVVVSLPESVSTKDLSAVDFATIEPDYYAVVLEDEPVDEYNDEFEDNQWYLPLMDSNEVEPSVVAVVDTGVCLDHPDLDGKFLQGYDFVEDDETAQDEFGHGCSVAGIIAAKRNNEIGIAGLTESTRILPVRVLDENGVGSYSDVAAGIIWSVDNGAEVINLSLGGYQPSSILKDAVDYAVNHDVEIIAAAGNTGNETVLYPAKYDNVTAVGAVKNIVTDGSYEIASFSARGGDVDVWAPGEEIFTTTIDGGYGYVNGTSFAAPVFSGGVFLDGGSIYSENEVDLEASDEVATPQSDENPSHLFNNTNQDLYIVVNGKVEVLAPHTWSDTSKDVDGIWAKCDSEETACKSFYDAETNTNKNLRVYKIGDGSTVEVYQSIENKIVLSGNVEGGVGNGFQDILPFSVFTCPPKIIEWESYGSTKFGCSDTESRNARDRLENTNYKIESCVEAGIFVNDPQKNSECPAKNNCEVYSGPGVVIYKESDCVESSDKETFTQHGQIVNLKDNTTYSRFNDNIKSIKVTPGWSVKVFQNYADYKPYTSQLDPGQFACLSYSTWNLSQDKFTHKYVYSGWNTSATSLNGSGVTIAGHISSIEIFNNEDCNGELSCSMPQSQIGSQSCGGNSNPQPNSSGDNATFISDVTIPDNTPIGPNQTFLKTWRVQNTGTTTWDTNYRLAFQYGSKMGGAYSVGIPHSVAPGETVDVSVTLTSPSNAGSYRGYWQIQDASGTNIGHILWVDIEVENNAPLPSSLETIKLYTQANYGGGISFENGKGEYSGLTANTYSLDIPSNWSVVTYKENDFGGNDSRCWYESEDNLQDHSWHNSIKSVKIYNYNFCSGNQKVKLYSQANYGGSLVNELNLGESNAPDKNTYSIQIPNGWSVKTWDQNDKKGRSRCWNESENNLQDHESWHLSIDSVEVFPTDTCPSTASFVKLCKDTGAHAGANCTEIESDISSLGNWGFGNDVARSIWIEGPWEVELYKDDNFQGDKYLYRDSTNDIANHPGDSANPNNDYGASSIKVRRYNPAYVTMYRNGDYNDGNPFKTDRTLDDLGSWGFDNNANSISIASGYEVIACEHPNFKGICGRLKGDDANAYDYGKSVTFPRLGSYLQGKISSLVVCEDECGETPSNYNLLSPLDSSSYIPETAIEFEWSGEGEEFKVEILGGEFGETVGANSGWITENTWSYSDLEPSETPYRWRVTGWNEFGTGTTSVENSFMVEDISIEDVFIIGDQFVNLGSDLQLLGIANPLDASNLQITWSPQPVSGQGTFTPIYSWDQFGSKSITLTVENLEGSVNTSFDVEVGCVDGEYLAEYFNGRELQGNAIKQECVDRINKDWGESMLEGFGAETGDGHDGSLEVNSGQTFVINQTVTNPATSISSETSSIEVLDPNGFEINDAVLVIQSTGETVGTYEIAYISSIDENTLNLKDDLANSYVQSGNAKTQIQLIPQYTDVQINGVLTVDRWNGNVGGIATFFANGNVSIGSTGSVDVLGKGYRATSTMFSNSQGTSQNQGEGYMGTQSRSSSENYGGGGGGKNETGHNAYNIKGAGGGGHATAGTNSSQNYGKGGNIFGDEDLSQSLTFGGAGGKGGDHWRIPSGSPQDKKAMSGGGIIMIKADEISVDGDVNADGGNGYVWNDCNFCEGGGGAGGSIYLSANVISTSTSDITAKGGDNYGSRDDTSGDGGFGRVHIEQCDGQSIATSPTAETVETLNCANDNFSIRWTGTQNFDYDLYSAHIEADDGIRVWIDDQVIYDAWSDGSHSTDINNSSYVGEHTVKVEYYENTGNAYVQFDLVSEPPNETPVVTDIQNQVIDINNSFTPIDLNNFGSDADSGDTLTWSFDGNTELTVDIDQNNIATVTAPHNWSGSEEITFTLTDQRNASDSDPVTFQRYPCATGEYQAEYFDNNTLTGDPTFTQCESDIDYDWGASGPGLVSWYDSSWQYRKSITIDADQVGSDLTDFPAYINLTDLSSDFFTNFHGTPASNDIVVTAANGVDKLEREVVDISTVNETGELWVKIPNLSSTQDTTIYIYYGNQNATEVNNTGVWNSNYKAVYHLNESSGTRKDSTVNSNNLSDHNTVTSNTGAVEKASDFETNNHEYLKGNDSASTSISGDLTISATIKLESLASTLNHFSTILSKYNYSNQDREYVFGTRHTTDRFSILYSSNGNTFTEVQSLTQLDSSDIGEFIHIAVITDVSAQTATFVINGIPEIGNTVATNASGLRNGTSPFVIGANNSGSANHFDGLIDEVRLYSGLLSTDWVVAEYNNQFNTNSFYEVNSDLSADNFSIRLTGLQNFTNDSYTFTVTADDGVRGWIDGQSIFDEWSDGIHNISVNENISGFSGVHEVVIEYYENTGDSEIEVDLN